MPQRKIFSKIPAVPCSPGMSQFISTSNLLSLIPTAFTPGTDTSFVMAGALITSTKHPWKAQTNSGDEWMPVNISVNTPAPLKTTRNHSGIWLRFQKLLCKGSQGRDGCSAGGCPPLLLPTIWGNSLPRRPRDLPGTQVGLSYCNHRDK